MESLEPLLLKLVLHNSQNVIKGTKRPLIPIIKIIGPHYCLFSGLLHFDIRIYYFHLNLHLIFKHLILILFLQPPPTFILSILKKENIQHYFNSSLNLAYHLND